MCLLEKDHHSDLLTFTSYIFFPLVIKTFKIYFLSNFHIHSTLLLAIITIIGAISIDSYLSEMFMEVQNEK